MDVITHQKRPIWKRLRWVNILSLLFSIGLAILFSFWFASLDDYEVTYMEYHVQQNDSLFNVVQDHNEHMPWGWNTHDLVDLTLEKNHIQHVTKVQAGDVIWIPIITKKE